MEGFLSFHWNVFLSKAWSFAIAFFPGLHQKVPTVWILLFFTGVNSPPCCIYNWDSFLILLASLPFLNLTHEFLRLEMFLEQTAILEPETILRFCTQNWTYICIPRVLLSLSQTKWEHTIPSCVLKWIRYPKASGGLLNDGSSWSRFGIHPNNGMSSRKN